MKAEFRPNTYGGWYYSVIDDNGDSHGSYYVRYYSTAVRKAKKLAKRLNNKSSRKLHTLDLDTGNISYNTRTPYRSPEPDYDPDAVVWIKASGMREDGRVSVRLGDIMRSADDART